MKKIQDYVIFDSRKGPWWYIEPDLEGNQEDLARWMHSTNDFHLKVFQYDTKRRRTYQENYSRDYIS